MVRGLGQRSNKDKELSPNCVVLTVLQEDQKLIKLLLLIWHMVKIEKNNIGRDFPLQLKHFRIQ